MNFFQKLWSAPPARSLGCSCPPSAPAPLQPVPLVAPPSPPTPAPAACPECGRCCGCDPGFSVAVSSDATANKYPVAPCPADPCASPLGPLGALLGLASPAPFDLLALDPDGRGKRERRR